VHTFRSDNCAGLCPEAQAALIEANDGHADAYGDDLWSREATSQLRRLFGDEISAGFVTTGTAANTLAIASLTEPWQQVLCHVHSHYNDDESTAPERFTQCRTVQVRSERSKLVPDDLAGLQARGDVHQPQPGVVTVSNPTEFGSVYTPEELVELTEAAHEAGYRVHVDGARFANAVAALGCHPRALTVEAGVDAMSFGGTKNGLACGDAVIFFPQGDGEAYEAARVAFPFHRKSTGHLLSKHRFITAPFAASLRAGAWLEHAAHANAMAGRLAEGLVERGYELRFPTEANAVFVVLSPEADEALQARGHGYYRFGDRAWNMFRLMCSFDTQPEHIDTLLDDASAIR
jgi:threonine aldolase